MTQPKSVAAARPTDPLLNRAYAVVNELFKDRPFPDSDQGYPLHAVRLHQFMKHVVEVTEDDLVVAVLNPVLRLGVTTAQALYTRLQGATDDDRVSRVVSRLEAFLEPSERPENADKKPHEKEALDLEYARGLPKEDCRVRMFVLLDEISETYKAVGQHVIGGTVQIDSQATRMKMNRAYKLASAMGKANPLAARMIRDRLLELSGVPHNAFSDVPGANTGRFGVFGQALAVTSYRMTCPSCDIGFEMRVAHENRKSTDGQELHCPACGHRSTYLVTNEDSEE